MRHNVGRDFPIEHFQFFNAAPFARPTHNHKSLLITSTFTIAKVSRAHSYIDSLILTRPLLRRHLF